MSADDEKASTLCPKRKHQDAAGSSGAVDALSVSPTITLIDPKVLDCVFCHRLLSIPVYQCDNGHLSCSTCCRALKKTTCPSCSLPIGQNQNLAVEKVLKSVKISCKNITYGCKETIRYDKKSEHERSMCIHQPCSCPHHGCEFLASSKILYLHYYEKHLDSAINFNYNSFFTVPIKKGVKNVILQESVDKTLFVLNYGVESIGNSANITCIAPDSFKKGFSYELVASKGDNNVKLESFTKSIQRCPSLQLSCFLLHFSAFLLVPSYFLDSSGGHNFQVCIRSGAQGES
ncbi:hypothetical protein ACET3Z_014161 [Daucus carota]